MRCVGRFAPPDPLGPAATKARFRRRPCHRGRLRFRRPPCPVRIPVQPPATTGFPLVPPIPVNRRSELDVAVHHESVTVGRALNLAEPISVCPPFGSVTREGQSMSYQVGVDLGSTFSAIA